MDKLYVITESEIQRIQDLLDRLADQQAMSDDSWKGVWGDLKFSLTDWEYHVGVGVVKDG